MRRLRLARAAQEDLEALLTRSAVAFGTDGRQRYERLIATALGMIVEDYTVGSRRRDLRPGVFVFHTSLARRLARRLGPTVKRPRHFVVYRIADEDVVEVVRVLHDAMDLDRHLPLPDEDT